MNDEQKQELASLYVLGLLDGRETSDFEARMQSDEELARLVGELREGAASLAIEVEAIAPPSELKARLLETISTAKVVAYQPRGGWLPWALAAGFAVLASVLALDRARQQEVIADLRDRVEFSQLRIASLSSLLKGAPGAVATVAWDAQRQKGILDVRNLPAVESGHDYQLWVIDPSYEVPVSAGIFRVENGVGRMEFKPVQNIASASKFAVSVERAGGSQTHEGPIVLVGE